MTIYKFSSGELDDSKTPVGQLNDKKLTNADWAMITKYLKDHDNITELNLSKNHLTNIDRDFVNAAKAHPKLIKINCDNNSLNMRTGSTGSYIDNIRRPETHLNPKDVEELNNFLQQRITDAINDAKDQLPHVLGVMENFKNKKTSNDFRFENQLAQISRLIEVLQRIPVAQLKDDPDTSHLKGFMESDQYRLFSTFITVLNNLNNIDSGKKREQSLIDIDKILSSSSSFIDSVNIYQAIYNRFQHYLSNPNQASVEQILFLLQLAGRYLEKSTEDIIRINDQIMSLVTKLLKAKVAEVENECNILLRDLSSDTSYITLLQLYDTYAVLLNHETELANLLNNTRVKLFDRPDISLDTYKTILAKLSNTNDSFPKETVSLSIAHNTRLTGPTQAALLRELSSIMRPDEKKQPAYIAAEKKITNKLYQEGIEAYLAQKHDENNKERARTLLNVIKDEKKSSFDRDMDILSILSSSKYAKLKALLTNAAIVEYGFNPDRFKKLSEKEQLRNVEAAILQKNDIVKIIVNNKPVLLKIDSQALFREWHAIARLVARYTLAKDFDEPVNYMLLTTAIREAKDLITLHKALDQLKERCRAQSPITEALSKITDGIRNYRSPTNESTEIFDKIVKIRKYDLEDQLKSSSAALFPRYTSKQEKEEVNGAEEYQLNRKHSSSTGSRG